MAEQRDHPDNPQLPVVEAAPADLQNLPMEMLRSSRFVGYKIEAHGGRPNCKVPKDPHTGGNASSTDPDTWSDIQTAIASVATHGFDGVGLVIGEPFLAVDIDKVRNADSGETEEWATEIIDELNSYTELSPSKRGFHIWLKGKPPQGKEGARTDDLEVYAKKRYFTMSGAHVKGTPTTIRDLTTAEVAQLFAKVEKRRNERKVALQRERRGTRTEQATDGSSVSNKKYQLLKEGKIEDAGFEDVSAAVQSFLTYSAYYNLCDTEKIDADFRASELHRDWRPHGHASDWTEKWSRLGPSEIAKACDTAKQWIERDRKKSKKRLQPVDAIGGFMLTDMGNGERLVAAVGSDFRFVHDFKEWRVWDEVRWSVDGTAEIHRRAKGVVRGMMKVCAELENEDEITALKAWAFACEAKWKEEAMVGWASRELAVASRSEDYDQSPWLFNCANGTYDLETNTFRPANRAEMLTKRSPVLYDPAANCKRWVEFLERILPDASIRDFLQVSLGYSLSGHAWEKYIWFLIGELGDNGKTTFIEALRYVFGDSEGYGTNMNFHSLMPREGNGNAASGDIARLRGARFVSACESDKNQKLSGAIIKRLTGGGDKITARKLYKDEFEFRPEFKLWLATNHPPVLTVDDDALWRRILKISFDVRVPKEEQDGQLADKLRAQAPGIFNWMLDGWKRYRAEGLKVPAVVQEATGKYRNDLDTVVDWREECSSRQEPLEPTFATKLYESYKAYRERTRGRNTKILGYKTFYSSLRRLGVREGEKDHTTAFYIALRDSGRMQGADEEEPF